MAEEPTQTTTEAPPQQGQGEPAQEVTDTYAKTVLDDAFLKLPGAKEFMDAVPEAVPQQVQVETQHPSQPTQQSIVDGELREPVVEQQPAEVQPEVQPEVKPEVEVKQEALIDDEGAVIPPSGDAAQEKWNLYRRGYKEAQQLKVEIENYKQQVAQAEAIRAELEQSKQAIDAARQEREAIEGELYRGRVVATQAFQQQVTQPYNTITQAAEYLAKESEIDPSALLRTIVQGDKKGMIELTAGLHSYDQTKVYTMYDDMRRVEATRDNLIRHSKEAHNAYVQHQQQEQEKYVSDILDTRNKSVEELVPRFKERLVGVIPTERMPDLGVISKAAIGFENWSEPVKMFSAFASVLLPEVLDQVGSLQTQLKTAQSEITRLRGGAPRTTAGQPQAPPTVKTPVNGGYQGPKPGETFDPLRLAQSATDRIRQQLGWGG
jgi:hypothetical protein